MGDIKFNIKNPFFKQSFEGNITILLPNNHWKEMMVLKDIVL